MTRRPYDGALQPGISLATNEVIAHEAAVRPHVGKMRLPSARDRVAVMELLGGVGPDTDTPLEPGDNDRSADVPMRWQHPREETP